MEATAYYAPPPPSPVGISRSARRWYVVRIDLKNRSRDHVLRGAERKDEYRESETKESQSVFMCSFTSR